jgi:hypothetical protein
VPWLKPLARVAGLPTREDGPVADTAFDRVIVEASGRAMEIHGLVRLPWTGRETMIAHIFQIVN